MAKTEQASDIALRPRVANVTLFRWLYDELRAAILDGRLRPERRLPSSRSIARQHGLSRGTVVSVFEQLSAEGYLETHVGSGSYVRRSLPDRFHGPARGRLAGSAMDCLASLSDRGRSISRYPFRPRWSGRTFQAFRVGQPEVGTFPVDLWGRIASRCLRTATPALLSISDPLGFRPLREEVAALVGRSRGVLCTADEVVITSGTQQSIDLVSRLLFDRGDRVWVEEPGYPGVTLLLRALGADIVPVPVDKEGVNPSAGRAICGKAKLAYVTPAHQFPLGVTMSPARRHELLKWAREAGAWIFEDDYDGEFQFAGRLLPSLRSLDGNDCVIYSNTFNKVLFPTLRLGYIVVPRRLIDAVAAAKSIVDRFAPSVDQAILCDFITEGHMGRHIRRMREIYASRLEVLAECARRQLGGLIELTSASAGLQVVGWLAEGIDEIEAWRLSAERGVETVPLSRFSINKSTRPALMLGLSAVDEPAIRRGVEVLAAVLSSLKRRREPSGRLTASVA